MFLRPVGPHRRPSSTLNRFHAIALVAGTDAQLFGHTGVTMHLRLPGARASSRALSFSLRAKRKTLRFDFVVYQAIRD
jgi:hypothetical protein